jgi:hypothetical protein
MGSEATMQAVLQEFHACQAEHHKCQTGPPLLPTRLVNVGVAPYEAQNDISKLHKSSPEERGNYVALSYCWGGPQKIVTSNETLTAMMSSLPRAMLPETIRDAIKVTRQSGIRYLWIDTLCIMQNNTSNQSYEIANMGNIYKNATLTIAANNSLSTEEAFLKDFFAHRYP